MADIGTCPQADARFRARENATELTGSQAAMLSKRLSECVEQRMKVVASEFTNQQR